MNSARRKRERLILLFSATMIGAAIIAAMFAVTTLTIGEAASSDTTAGYLIEALAFPLLILVSSFILIGPIKAPDLGSILSSMLIFRRYSMDLFAESYSYRASRAVFLTILVFFSGMSLFAGYQDGPFRQIIPHTCETIHICSPKPPTDIPLFESNWSRGSDFNAQVAATLEALRAEYPHFDIQAEQTGEDTRSFPFGMGVEHKYHGRFVFTPKWKGFINIR